MEIVLIILIVLLFLGRGPVGTRFAVNNLFDILLAVVAVILLIRLVDYLI